MSDHPAFSTAHTVHRRALVLAASAGLVFAGAASAQMAPWPQLEVPLGWDSGPVMADRGEVGPVVVWQTAVQIPTAAWLRLRFEDVQLAGVIEEGSAAWLRITSETDGAQQVLNAESVADWSYHTAHFNGDTLHIELLAHPNTGPSRVVIHQAIMGLPTGVQTRSICDGVDLRQLSYDPRAARHSTGCTMWLFHDTNRMMGTAGHCGASGSHSAQFNVPLSTASGQVVLPPPEHQYPVQAGTSQLQNSGVGQDWAYFSIHRNSNTGLTAYQAQGEAFDVVSVAPPVSGQMIRITGYGTVSSPVSPTWNQVQKTHAGPFTENVGTTLRYRPDTTGGNSGSPVVDDSTGLVIGVHTHGGCTSTGGANQGTAIHHTGWQNALNNPLGLAASGRGTVTPPLFGVGDMINNFGTLNIATGNFAKIEAVSPWMQGLAYDPNDEVFYAVNHNPFTNERRLFAIDPVTAEETLIAPITGTTAVINGLGYDPTGQILYGISQANGQLFRITLDGTNAGQAVPIGAPGGGTVGGLEYNRELDALFGLDRSTNPARLVIINTGNGQQTVIGSLGSGITDVSGLGATDEGDLFTVNAANGQLLKINPQTGAATAMGASGGLFGAAYGMSAIIPPGEPPAIRITFPSGLPFLIAPAEGYQMTVNVIPGTQNVLAGSPKVHYRADSSSQFASMPLIHVSGDEYTVTLPPFACGSLPELYFSAEGHLGGQATLPRDAPTSLFSTRVGIITDPAILEAAFETAWPTGWSATGMWHVTNACAPGGNTCATGPYAYYGRTVTCNYNLPTGAHNGTLTSPEFDVPQLPPGGTAKLTFCYALETEESPNFDKAELLINGESRPEWRLLDVRPSTAQPDRFWAQAEFDLTEFAGQAIKIGFKFDTVNSLNNHFRGLHLNNVKVTATSVGCETSCYANCDGSTTQPVLNVDDFTCFINEFAAAQSLPHHEQVSHYANCDGSTSAPVLNVDDFTCFINAFAAGCP